MRVAVLADIHGNIAALDAVLAQARGEGIDQLVLLGDYVGYYYAAGAVIERLRGWHHIAIRGNHDRLLLEARGDNQIRADYRDKYGSSIDMALDELDATAIAWIEALPERRTITVGATAIELCHGAPFDPDFYVYPTASHDILSRCEIDGVDAVWMGHTHWPFQRPGRPWLLNPGSVGQPRDIGGLASWCIFDGETGTTAFRRTEFDTVELTREIKQRDPHLLRNRDVLQRRRLKSEVLPS